VAAKCTIIKAHSQTVSSVTFSNDESLLLTGSHDKSIKVWADPPLLGSPLGQHKGHSRPPLCFAWCMQIWSLTTERKFKATLTGHSNWVQGVEFTRDARLVVSGADDKTVRVRPLPYPDPSGCSPHFCWSPVPCSCGMLRLGRRCGPGTDIQVPLRASRYNRHLMRLWPLRAWTSQQG
jgi:WD40 repeat protein